ncbi:MAG: hypothetical protein IJ555_00010 [Ruminococcus sp.]|nr:hypothetical protein [Ruminococcus sp.]MBR1750964.1 hypothetical protein [Ruminococcus sp.]
MYNRTTAKIDGQTFELYYIGFKSEARITTTPTVSSGLYRTLSGTNKNIYTLKGRAPAADLLYFTGFINTHVGTLCPLIIANSNVGTFMVMSGECTSTGDGMCEYVIELGVAEA